MKKSVYESVKPVLISILLFVIAVLTPLNVLGQNGASTSEVKVLLSKVEKETDTAIANAKLGLFQGEGTTGTKIKEITTTKDKIELSLKDGTYTLSELQATVDYKKAKDITFKIEKGKLYVKRDAKFVESENFETLASDNYEAFADRNDDSKSWGFDLYSKHYYLRENDSKGQVIYCFNIDLKEPVESYDEGATAGDSYGDGDIRYTKIVNPLGLRGYAKTPRESDAQIFYNKVRKVIYAGYPNNMKNFKGDLTDTEFKTATQLAVYYYTDSIDVQTVAHGFEGIREDKGAKVRAVFDKLIQYADSTEAVPDTFKMNMFRSNNAKYQNMIGTTYNADNLIYTLKMESEKEIVPSYKAGELRTIVKVGNVSATLNEADATKSKEAMLSESDVTKPLTISDTIKYSQLLPNTSYRVTARLMKIVNGKEPEEIATQSQTIVSSYSGEGTWIMLLHNVKLESNAKYVVFEKAETNDIFRFKEDTAIVEKKHIAVHEDVNDKAQTIIVSDKKADNSQGDANSQVGALETTVSVYNNQNRVLATGYIGKEAQLEAHDIEEAVTIKDSISYKFLVSKAKYKVTTRLMKVTDDKVDVVKDENNQPIQQETEFETSETGAGTWDVTFSKKVKLEANAKYVIYEKAVSVDEHEIIENGNKITKKQEITHENKDDKAQTIIVKAKLEDSPVGTLQTTVSVLNGSHTVLARGLSTAPATLESYHVHEKVTVKDTINYKNLVAHAKYKVVTRLMKITNNTVEVVKDDTGKALEKTTELIADDSGNGSWDVTFEPIKLAPSTKYVVYETVESIENYDFIEKGQKVNKKQTISHEDKTDTAQTIVVKDKLVDSLDGMLRTTVSVLNNHTVLATGMSNVPATVKSYQVNKPVSVKDTIYYQHLKSGAKYKVTTRLMKVTGDTVEAVTDANGQAIQQINELTASSNGTGSWDVTFNTVTLTPNTKYVVYETAESVDTHEFIEQGAPVTKKQIVIHEDKNDKAQTIVVNAKLPDSPLGSLQTTVSVLDDNNTVLAKGTPTTEATLQSSQVDNTVVIKDTINYQNLVPNAKYKVTTRLMTVTGDTVEVVTDENGQAIQKENELTASSNGTGSWDVTFNTVTLTPNTKYVVYETAESVDTHDFIEQGAPVTKKQIVTHEDKNDKAQTIVVNAKLPDSPLGSLQTTVSVLDDNNTVLAKGTPTTEATLQSSQVDNTVVIKDTINYQNLVPNAKYKVTTRLMKVTGDTVEAVTDASGQAIQQINELTASSNGTGSWDVLLGQVALQTATKYVIYEIVESVLPHDFIENGKVVNKKQYISHEDKHDKAQTIVVNKKIEKALSFSKVEVNKTDELVGAHLKIVKGDNDNGQVIKSWVSTHQMMMLTLQEGVYTMVESQAPLGYYIAESITFRVTKEGTLEVQQQDGSYKVQQQPIVRMEDKKIAPQMRTIKVTKVWKDYLGNNVTAPIEKIKVELYRDGQATGQILELSALNHWSGHFTNLPITKQYGDSQQYNYFIKEVGEINNSVHVKQTLYKVEYSGNVVDGFTITNQGELKTDMPPILNDDEKPKIDEPNNTKTDDDLKQSHHHKQDTTINHIKPKKNSQKLLPQTGNTSSMAYVLYGGLLVILSVLCFVLNIRLYDK